MRTEFPKILEELLQLEEEIDHSAARLLEEQRRNGGRHLVNDPLRGTLGWLFVLKAGSIHPNKNVTVRLWNPIRPSSGKDFKIQSAGHYVNVRMAKENAPSKLR